MEMYNGKCTMENVQWKMYNGKCTMENQPDYIQYGWCREKSLSSKVLWVFEHEEEVKVSHKDTN